MQTNSSKSPVRERANKEGEINMKINDNTPAVDIIDGHEKRIGTLELVLHGFLLFLCLRSMAKIISDKLHNLKYDS